MLSNQPVRAALGAVAIMTLVLSTTSCALRGAGARDGDGYVLKFSHVTTTETPKGQAAEKFKELAEAECGDQLTVEIYPNSELYGDEDEMQAIQSGAVQMAAPASAKFTTIAPQLQVLDLPFLFDTLEDVPAITAPGTPVGDAIYDNEDLAIRDVKVLGLWDNGLKVLSSNTPMATPEDLDGVKFRIQPSDVLRGQFTTWGAEATPMAFAEVYSALQQGVIDGQENPYSNIESQKMNQVQKYVTESNHGYIGYVNVINQEFFDLLPPDVQTCVTDAAAGAADFNRRSAAQVNEEAKEAIRESGTTEITELTDPQRQAFKDAVVPRVWEKHADVIGQDLIDDLLAEHR